MAVAYWLCAFGGRSVVMRALDSDSLAIVLLAERHLPACTCGWCAAAATRRRRRVRTRGAVPNP